jgi:hypothetical protein
MAEIYVNIWECPPSNKQISERPITEKEQRALKAAGASGHIAISNIPPGHVAYGPNFLLEGMERHAGHTLAQQQQVLEPLAQAYQARMEQRK